MAVNPKDRDSITLTELRILVTICDNDLNVTAAAQQLDIAQPSVSKKLFALEKVLGQSLFFRNGKRFQYQTDLCRRIVPMAREILLRCDNILEIAAADRKAEIGGQLNIGTTHTQARYALPEVLKKFRAECPAVVVHLQQGSPAELIRLLSGNQLDMVICTEGMDSSHSLKTMTAYAWNRVLVMRRSHPLAKTQKLTLKAIAAHPIVTYTPGFTGRESFDRAFANANLAANVFVSATDADIIKTYVRLGFGAGVIAAHAYEKDKDRDLVKRSVAHLFPPMRVRLAYQRDKFISAPMQKFVDLFLAHAKHVKADG